MKKHLLFFFSVLVFSFTFCFSQSSFAQGVVPDAVEFQALKDLYESTGGDNWFNKTNWPAGGGWPTSATAAQMGTWYGITVENGDVVGINLYENNVNGTLPASVGQLTKLVSINFGFNSIHGNIPSSLNNLLSLQGLFLYYNNFDGAIPDLNALTNLVSLDLSVNAFAPAPIPSWIGTLTHLKGIGLFRANVTGGFPSNFHNLNELVSLDLAQNGLAGPIPEWIGDLTKLQSLNLNSNSWTGHIPESICNLTDMLYLQIANCGYIGGGIPKQIGNLSNLQILSFWMTNISGSIPASVNNLHQLTQLQLFQTQLSGPLPKMDQMTSLQYLYVHYSQLEGSIDVLKDLPSLAYVSLSGNHFSGSIPKNLPASLVTIDFNYNVLSGSLPDDLDRLTHLVTLYANGNKLSGEIPAVFNNMNGLLFVDLSNNELTSISAGAYSRVSRGNLVWSLNGNRFDFAQLEALSTSGGNTTLMLMPQKELYEPAKVGFDLGQPLTIPMTHDPGQHTTIQWEKKESSGSTWTDVISSNEDATGLTFKRNAATPTDAGVYRWKMTNSQITGAPIYSTPITTDTNIKITLDNYAFQYKYDGRRRMTHKKVPGADWVYMVYDDRDRLVMTQDGEQRKENKWNYTQYDALNRPVITGVYIHSALIDQQAMSGLISTSVFYETYTGSIDNNGYSNAVFSGTNFSPGNFYPLTVTYYDTYDFKTSFGAGYDYLAQDVPSMTVNGALYEQPSNASNGVMGQVTGSKVRTLGEGNSFIWLRSVSYYDDKYRVTQSISDNPLGGIDRTTNLFDFVGKVLSSKSTHIKSSLQWKDKVGLETIGNTTLVKTTSDGGWGSSGAASVELLPANTDGWIEVSASELNTDRMIGFSTSNTDASYATINYSLYQNKDHFQVWETTNYKGIDLVISSGDFFRLERKGNAMGYYRNGVLLFNSEFPTNAALLVDVAMAGASGSLLQNIRTSFANESNTTLRTFTYDHAGRLLTTHHSIDGATPVLLAQNNYNELGQLIDKNLHSTDGTTFKQSTDYRYNIRGWLTSINNASLTSDANNVDANTGRDLFGMELSYEKEVAGLTTSNDVQFNGNISAIAYSNNLATGTIKSNGYKFGYDPMNRLTNANFRQKKASWGLTEYLDVNNNPQATESFSEKGFEYDLNGNINKLKRSGAKGTSMDDLSYTYEGNQLLHVDDNGDDAKGFADGNVAGDDYSYDANGNMITDANKNIAAITYNHLNLPSKVYKSTGEYITYTYDATGRKLSQQVYDASNTLKKKSDYAGEYFYENDTLKFINHEEGRIVIETAWESAPQKLPNSDAMSLDNFVPYDDVSLSNETIGEDSYLKVVNNTSNGYPGFVTDFVSVTSGEYTFKIKGYKSELGYTKLYVGGNGPGGAVDILWGPTLPTGPENEDWVSVNFTVPASVTLVRVGVIYKGWMDVGDSFYVNKLELLQYNTGHGNSVPIPDPVYQYHLKDHLGNVRTTFTTKEEVESATATLETAFENTERSEFLKYDDSKRVYSTLFDHTNNGPAEAPTPTIGGNAVRLNGSENERNGIARSISVMPGDKIDMQVFGKFIDPNTPHPDATAWSNLMGFVADVATAGSTIVIDGVSYNSSVLRVPPYTGVLTDPNESTSFPKAHLNWVIFDRNDNFIDGGARQLQGGAENGTDVPFGEINSPQIEIKEPGYVYIWLSNTTESTNLIDVYFDDFKVTHTKSPVVQQEEYYPFGLAFNSYSRENSTPNRYKYNSKEEITELDLNWYDYGARMYDATIGRWFVVDPLSEANRRWSPYRYAYNNPLRFIDPDGMFEVFINGSKANDATNQLDASSNLNITRDAKTGKLSASGEAKTKADKKLLEAIRNPDVKVNITADGSKTIAGPNGPVLMTGGAFMGNNIGTESRTTDYDNSEGGWGGDNEPAAIPTTETIVTTDQRVNPDVLGAMDAANGNSGSGMLHETLESYEGGLISLKKGVSSPAAGQTGSVYNKAHSRAPSQGATITGTYWDRAGNLLPSEKGATRVEMKSNGRLIMTYP